MRKIFVERPDGIRDGHWLDPKLYEAYYFYARTSFQQGDLARAAQLYEQASHVNPDDYQAPSLLAPIYKSLGRAAEADATRRRALQLAEKHVELHPDDARALYLGAGILCQLGERARGLEWAHRALATDPDETSIIYNVGFVYALSGEAEKAIECLERATARGDWYKGWAQKDSDLDSERSHPRFQSLLR